MAFSLFVQVTVIGSLSWLLWKVFRNFVVKSPLDNLPGPPPASVWKGTALPIQAQSVY